MKIFILLVWFHVGPISDRDSMSAVSIPHFTTLESCKLAGEQAAALTKATVKIAKYACLEGVR
jgi:hypothetical protein